MRNYQRKVVMHFRVGRYTRSKTVRVEDLTPTVVLTDFGNRVNRNFVLVRMGGVVMVQRRRVLHRQIRASEVNGDREV